MDGAFTTLKMVNKARKVLDLDPIDQLFQDAKYSDVIAKIHHV